MLNAWSVRFSGCDNVGTKDCDNRPGQNSKGGPNGPDGPLLPLQDSQYDQYHVDISTMSQAGTSKLLNNEWKYGLLVFVKGKYVSVIFRTS